MYSKESVSAQNLKDICDQLGWNSIALSLAESSIQISYSLVLGPAENIEIDTTLDESKSHIGPEDHLILSFLGILEIAATAGVVPESLSREIESSVSEYSKSARFAAIRRGNKCEIITRLVARFNRAEPPSRGDSEVSPYSFMQFFNLARAVEDDKDIRRLRHVLVDRTSPTSDIQSQIVGAFGDPIELIERLSVDREDGSDLEFCVRGASRISHLRAALNLLAKRTASKSGEFSKAVSLYMQLPGLGHEKLLSLDPAINSAVSSWIHNVDYERERGRRAEKSKGIIKAIKGLAADPAIEQIEEPPATGSV